MQFTRTLFFIAVLVLSLPSFSKASNDQEHHTENTEVSLKDKIKEDIQHHLLDAHDFHLFSDEETGAHYSFPLPVILIDNGLHVFMSSKFHHGETVAESNGSYYKLYHSKIYKTDAAGTMQFDEHHHALNEKPLDFSITKNVFSAIVISLLLFFMFRATAKTYQSGMAPSGIAKFLEPLVIYVRDEIAIPNIGEKHHRKYMGYLLTMFFFIWMVNLFGLTPLGINITGNIAVTFALAFMTFLITNVSGNKDYWMHIFWMPGVPIPLKIPFALIELLGIFIKPFALMIRLFANISAGHIVIMSLIGLLFVFQNWFARGAFLGLTLFLSVIELLVAFLQAYIFTMLSALYIGSAIAEHDEHH